MKKILFCVLISLIVVYFGYSRPQYSLLQTFGMKCENCHYNVQGGGVRTANGWMARKDISLIKPSSLGLGSFFDFIGGSNTFVNDIFTVGMDLRYQSAQWPSPTQTNPAATKRDQMLMQFSPYLIVTPVKWFSFEGMYNLAYDIVKDKRFIGQQPGAWSINFRPADNLPYLRIGYFQPTIATKYDDHTMLIYDVAMGTKFIQPFKPDDYAEFGAQLDYQSVSWLGASLGVFQSRNLAAYSATDYLGRTEPLVNSDRASITGRLAFYPTIGGGFNTFFGGMFLYNGPYKFNNQDINDTYFYMTDLFWNIGMGDKLALMTEYVSTEKQFARTTDNFLVELDYQLMDGLIAYARGERATTSTRELDNGIYSKPVVASNQFVFGLHIAPLPFIDLIPEYRIYRSEELLGTMKQWAFQLHVFY